MFELFGGHVFGCHWRDDLCDLLKLFRRKLCTDKFIKLYCMFVGKICGHVRRFKLHRLSSEHVSIKHRLFLSFYSLFEPEFYELNRCNGMHHLC